MYILAARCARMDLWPSTVGMGPFCRLVRKLSMGLRGAPGRTPQEAPQFVPPVEPRNGSAYGLESGYSTSATIRQQ
jgi:hypothetical protein